MRRTKDRHIVFGDPTHPDCPLCKLQAADASPAKKTKTPMKGSTAHPAECPCRFCKPKSSVYVFAPLQPWEDEVIDVAVGQADGSLKITGSYRVERDGSMTWLTGHDLHDRDVH